MIRAALAALALGACATSGAPDASCGAPETAAATMQAIIDADNARDLERVMTYYTEDVVWRPPSPRQPMRGAAAIRVSYEHMYAVFNPNLAVTVEQARFTNGVVEVSGHTSGVLVPQMTDVPHTNVNDAYTATLRCGGGHWRVAEMAWGPAS